MGSDLTLTNTREMLHMQMVWNLKWGNYFYTIDLILNWSVKLKATDSQIYRHEYLLRSRLSPQLGVKCVFLAGSLENSKFPMLVHVHFPRKKKKTFVG